MKKKLIIFSLFVVGITTPAFSHNSENTKINCGVGNSNLLVHNYNRSTCSGSCSGGDTCTDFAGTKYQCCAGSGLGGDQWGVKGSCIKKAGS